MIITYGYGDKMNKTIGLCSICGGRVVVPDVWLGVDPPRPTCSSCGAKKREDLPVIQMERSSSTIPYVPARLPTITVGIKKMPMLWNGVLR